MFHFGFASGGMYSIVGELDWMSQLGVAVVRREGDEEGELLELRAGAVVAADPRLTKSGAEFLASGGAIDGAREGRRTVVGHMKSNILRGREVSGRGVGLLEPNAEAADTIEVLHNLGGERVQRVSSKHRAGFVEAAPEGMTAEVAVTSCDGGHHDGDGNGNNEGAHSKFLECYRKWSLFCC